MGVLDFPTVIVMTVYSPFFGIGETCQIPDKAAVILMYVVFF